MHNLTTALLVDRGEAISALVDLMESQWPDWYNWRGASARADLSERMQRAALPLGIVALVDDEPVGTCALTVSSGGLVTERSPWLGGLVVAPRWRRHGVGVALLRRARAETRRLGHERLYALTAEARGLFEREGFRLVETVRLGDEPHAIFVISTAS